MVRWPRGACGLFLLALGGTLTGCGIFASATPTEYPNATIPATKFTTLAVLPSDPKGHDPGIAARARQNLRAEGVEIIMVDMQVAEGASGMLDLCPKDKPARFTGVVFVTWDHLSLRDCETHEIAYEINGRYAGIDEMTKRLARYLKGS